MGRELDAARGVCYEDHNDIKWWRHRLWDSAIPVRAGMEAHTHVWNAKGCVCQCRVLREGCLVGRAFPIR
jgi:hypothetical protein